DQSPGYVLTEPLDSRPKRFQAIAVADNCFEGSPPVVSTNRWMAKDVCDHGARPTQSFEIKKRTPVGEGFPDRQALGRQVHGTECHAQPRSGSGCSRVRRDPLQAYAKPSPRGGPRDSHE